jgi:hypothetical protein
LAAACLLAGAAFFPDAAVDLTEGDFRAEATCFFAGGAFLAALFADFGGLAADLAGLAVLRAFGDEVIRPGR